MVADKLRRHGPQVVLCAGLGEGGVRQLRDHRPRVRLPAGDGRRCGRQPAEVLLESVGGSDTRDPVVKPGEYSTQHTQKLFPIHRGGH